MEIICLQFNTRKQLFEFLKQTSVVHCTVDLENLTLSSFFSEADRKLAMHRYSASALVDSYIY
jgi:hypothetical protein